MSVVYPVIALFIHVVLPEPLKLPVFAGPVEATAIGNILVQMMSLGDIENIKQGRKLIKEVYKIKEY